MDQSEEINDESDHELDSPKGYYTRAKRRKLSERYQDKEEAASTSGLYRIPEVGKRKNPIMFVPTEVLQNIFRHISYHELSSKMRLVNRRFKTVAEDFLNLGFLKIEQNLDSLIKATDLSLGYTQDDMEIKCISKLLCLLEIISSQYGIIKSTIWRYVYNGFYKTPRTCMYGGMIIDTYDTFVRKFLHYPQQLYAPAVLRDYALPPEATKIIQMTKTFCVHFDKTSEETLTNSCTISGCKISDILDCAKFCQKITHFERKNAEVFFAKYSYFFKNSWFIAMPIPPSKEMDWSQKQRMMHMRLRRIVLAHNDMYLQQEQFQREVILRPSPEVIIKKPGNNVYTGYGDVEDKFFYYGVMNDGNNTTYLNEFPEQKMNYTKFYRRPGISCGEIKCLPIVGAFLSKFHSDEDNDEQDDEDDVVNDVPAQNDVVIEMAQANSDEDILYRLPYLGFKVDVAIQCPVSFAPLKFLKSLPYEEQLKLRRKSLTKGETRINMDFECYGAHYARLPTRYQYHFISKRS